MKIYSDYNLCNFEFWGGAKEKANLLTLEDFEQIEYVLDDIYLKDLKTRK